MEELGVWVIIYVMTATWFIAAGLRWWLGYTMAYVVVALLWAPVFKLIVTTALGAVFGVLLAVVLLYMFLYMLFGTP